MPPRVALNVSLTPELQRLIHDKVASGRYQSASEVVRAGLRLLEVDQILHAPWPVRGPADRTDGTLLSFRSDHLSACSDFWSVTRVPMRRNRA